MKKICLLIFIHLCIAASAGNDSTSVKSRFRHELGMYGGVGYILPTNGFYCGFNPLGRHFTDTRSAFVQYSFSYPESSRYGRLYPSAYQGFSIGINSFGSHEHIGTPISLHFHQGASIASLGRRFTLDYEWHLGLSYGWVTGNDGLTSSMTNIMLGGGFFLAWKPKDRCRFTLGPEFTHFSNGDTSFPNLGTNTVGVRLGISALFGPQRSTVTTARLFAAEEEKKKFKDRMSYDLTLSGGWRGDRFLYDGSIVMINDKFPIASISFNPLFHFNRYLSMGPALDVVLDRSANLLAYETDASGTIGYNYPPLVDQIAPAASMRVEIRMAMVALNGGFGYSFSYDESDMDVMFGIFNLKAFLSDVMYIGLSYRLSSRMYTHNLTFGLGWRL